MRKVRKIFDLLESHQAGENPDISYLHILFASAGFRGEEGGFGMS